MFFHFSLKETGPNTFGGKFLIKELCFHTRKIGWRW